MSSQLLAYGVQLGSHLLVSYFSYVYDLNLHRLRVSISLQISG